MSGFFKNSLSFKINAGLVVVLILIISSFSGLEIYNQYASTSQKLQRFINEVVDRVTNSTAQYLWTLDEESLEKYLIAEMSNQNLEAILARTKSQELEFAVGKGRNEKWEPVSIENTKGVSATLVKIAQVKVNDLVVGEVEVHVTDRFFKQELGNHIQSIFIQLAVLLTVSGLALAWLLSRYVITPVTTLMHTVEKISGGSLQEPIDTSREDEIGRLAKSFQVLRDAINNKISELNTEIVERKQAQSETLKTSSFLDNIINSMPSILIGVNPKYEITHWNLAASNETGISQEDAVGKKADDVFPMISRLKEKIESAMESREVVNLEKMDCIYSEKQTFVDVTLFPLVANGINGAVIRIDDVTETTRLQEVMVQTEKMMSVGGLAAGMAHEINNPLSAILQSIQNIRLSIDPERPKAKKLADEMNIDLVNVRKYLEKRKVILFMDAIHESGTRAAKIVADMLAFSRRSESKMAPNDLNTAIDQTIQLAATDFSMKKMYDFRHIDVVKEYQSDLPPVICNITEIQQVLLNLFGNAAQAMYQLKETTGRIPRIRIKTSMDGSHLRITVTDNGPGIDEEVKKRIFEPFFTTKQEGVGTGLGLSVSYFIITNNHKGRIQVESKLNEGTTFTIHLPVSKLEDVS